MGAFMGDGDQQGWLHKYLSWERPELKGVSTGCASFD